MTDSTLRKSWPPYLSVWLMTLVSLVVFISLWSWASHRYGEFIVPSPAATLLKLVSLLHQGVVVDYLAISACRVLIGCAASIVLGSLSGALAGFSPLLSWFFRPLNTLLMGTPAIAWIVLALLWFGGSNWNPVFTIVVTTLPIPFAAGLQGVKALDGRLTEMAASFGASRRLILTDVYFPQILSYLFPSWLTTLGMGWKVVAMSELLSCQQGIGAGLAAARVNLDMAATTAWILVIVCAVLVTEYVLFEPLKRKLETWRGVN